MARFISAKAPDTYMGKKKVFEEVFMAPHDYPSRSDALHKLNAVREGHPAASGWVEFDHVVKELPNGRWYVEILHAKYQ